MAEKKYIHYCWFGTKPLTKLAKKCIKSWEKYLSDYEIIKWSESNVDINECPFIKEAYAKRKWAFVADYARAKAMYEMGGIYFDTDMMIKKDVSFLLDKENFLGIEDSNMVNAAVWGTRKPHSELAKYLLDLYRSQNGIDENDLYSVSIPRLVTKFLNTKGFDRTSKDIQILNGDIYIYPRDYFYPLSYNYRNNVFTNNTCMTHYFDATWIDKSELREVRIYRKLGEKNGLRFILFARFVKRNIKRTAKIILFPVVLYRRYKRKITNEYLKTINVACQKLENQSDYVVFHNPAWFGVTSATQELFQNTIPCGELLRKKDIKKIGNIILNNNIKQVIFSAMCIGWLDLAKYLKGQRKDIKIKVYWHGNHSQVSEPYGWDRNKEIIIAHKQGIVDVFASCKKSLMNFYEKEGYKTKFITNRVVLNKKLKKLKRKGKDVRIGLYAAKSDDWRKNMYTQIAAVSLIPNVTLDIVPLSSDAKYFARSLGVRVDGIEKSISRDKLLTRMSENDVNLYVTFSECSPMVPLESFEMGVPCIFGNNHHCLNNKELKKYLVVDNEANPLEIAEKITNCLQNRKVVCNLANKWIAENNKQSKKDVLEFLEM